MESPIPYFSSLTDPRVERTKSHLLEDILLISISAIISGAESWNDIELFGKSKEDWLRTFLSLPEGIPSHDTFNCVFSSLDPVELEKCFMEWTRSVAELTQNEVIRIDGKSMRGTPEHGSKSIVHMVSAWAAENHIVLGQIKVDEKSNEITAIPKLLDLLAIEGCIVTIDAMGCQKEIAKAIIDKEVDYVLTLKGNQGNLEEQVEDSFRFCPVISSEQEIDMGHGRIETRRCSVITDLSMIEKKEEWINLQSLIKIESERYNKCKQTTEKETRLYISNLPPYANLINRSVRSHWSVENSLHWVLDVAFSEDHSRKRAGNTAQNFSMLNKIVPNLLKNEKQTKVGVKGKGLKAG